MPKTEFKRFTNPDVLGSIRVTHIAKFFDQFKGALMPRQVPPVHYLPGTPPYYATWIETLSSPETLPAPFVEAILAIEELAAPEKPIAPGSDAARSPRH